MVTPQCEMAAIIARRDFQGIAPSFDDIIEYRLAPTGEASLAALPVYNPSQKFYYYPMMRTDEVLIFKQQDSRDDVAKVCPHTSFIDPSAEVDVPERHSIDIRMLCVYREA